MIDAAGGGFTLALASAGGMLIGLCYFGALWWTVRRIPSARHPALLVAGTFVLRAGGAAAGIVLVSRGEMVGLLAAVAGFLVARTILIRMVGRPLSTMAPVGAAAAAAEVESRPGGRG